MKSLTTLVLATFAPAKMFACAACGSANANIEHSSMIDGMNLAILSLGAILLPVLGTFLALLIYAIRKSEAVEAARAGQALQRRSPTRLVASNPIRPASPTRSAFNTDSLSPEPAKL